MKKFALSVFLMLGFLFLFSKNILASCYPPGRGGCAGDIACAAGVCCETTGECQKFLQQNSDADTTSEQFQNLQNTTSHNNNRLNSTSNDPTCLNGEGINTAIGCIPVADTNQFMGWILGWAIGVGGGIAFLLIVYASFMTMTSQGNPERLKAGQELLTSAISGLIMLIFSVFILKFIGVDILGLDSFGFN